jgi:hypothetical protein
MNRYTPDKAIVKICSITEITETQIKMNCVNAEETGTETQSVSYKNLNADTKI